MKKFYVIVSGLLLSLGASSQCVINQSVFAGPNDYGIVPDTIQNLPIAYVGTPYVTDLQLHVLQDTTTSLGTFPFQDFTIDSVVGLPAGFTYMPNPTNGVIPGGGYGCVGLSGNPTAGQETGGPNNDGVYPITVYFTAIVLVFNVPTAFPATWTGYRVHIQNATSLSPAVQNFTFGSAQNAPNPADFRTEFRYTTPNGGEVEFTMYNMVGAVVKKSKLNAERGLNKFTMDTSILPAGVYMYSFKMGDQIVTRRMTVTH